MIQCPACRKEVPDWTETCQFCGADTKKVARTPSEQGQRRRSQAGTIQPWIWSAYYAVATYFIISGVGGIFETIRGTHEKIFGQEVGFSVFTYVGIALCAFTALIGLGLLLKVEIARGVANFLCGLNIIFGLFALAGATFGSIFSGILGVLLMLKIVIDLATNGFMIFLIGETDRGMKQ